MSNDFQQQLIDAARQRLAPELRPRFANLDREAQIDVALALLACADDLPRVFERKHLALLRESIDNLVETLCGPAGLARKRQALLARHCWRSAVPKGRQPR